LQGEHRLQDEKIGADMANLDFLTPLDGPEAEKKETPMDLFLRTGSPQIDPANAAPEGAIPAFLTPADDQQEVAPYDWTVAGAPLPEALRPMGDMVAGLNESLASVAGLATTDIDFIMRNLGMSGFLEKPGDGKKFIT